MLHFLPAHDRQAVGRRAFVVGLWRSESRQADLMLGIDAFGDVYEVGIGIVVSALYITVAPFAATQDRESPSILHHAGRQREPDMVHSIVAHSIEDFSAPLHVESAGRDIDCASDGGGGDDRCSESSLGLH